MRIAKVEAVTATALGILFVLVLSVFLSSSTAQEPQPAPFDLIADFVDDNGLPLNPKWGAQRINPNDLPDANRCRGRNPGSYPCTNQITYNDSGHFGCGPHVNWFGATYEGRIQWDSHSCSVCDDDYNMRLYRDDQAGYTTARREHRKGNHILCEFDSDETIDHFSSGWWSRFHNAVDDSDAKAGQMVDDKFAIVTGLMGLDCEHDCGSELHPVWALAMNVQPSLDDDVWAIFVRNWGNEGYCGTSQHFLTLPNNKYTFRLPWRPGATSVTFTDQSRGFAYHIQKPSWTVGGSPGQGVFVTFNLDAPRGDGSMWDAELHLKWAGDNLKLKPLPANKPPKKRKGEKNDPEKNRKGEKNDPEEILGELFKKMTPDQRKLFTEKAPKKKAKLAGKEVRPEKVEPRYPQERKRFAQPPLVSAQLDYAKMQRQHLMLKALAAAYGGKLPGLTSAGKKEH